jgi:hypothetical protein
MDKFLIIKKEKKYDIFAREKDVEQIVTKIKNNETFCIHGNSGVGKTFLIQEVLKNFLFIELNHTTLRSRADTNDFLETFKSRDTHLLIDDIDTDFLGWKELIEKIKNGVKISNGSLILIFKNNEKVSFLDSIQLEPLSKNKIIELGQKKFPKKNIDEIITNANKCKGNLRSFFYFFDFPDEQDLLLSPKDFVHTLLSPGDIKPTKFIGQGVDEHGYSWNIVHENYPRAKDIDLASVERISDCMSIADIYDNRIYNGDWQVFDFFCHEGIIHPSVIVGQRLLRETINPGSAWTKFNNMKMRMSKLKDLNGRQKKNKIKNDEMMLIKTYCEHSPSDEILSLLFSYKFKPPDLDLMNHLAIKNKLKAKALNNIKKELRKHE